MVFLIEGMKVGLPDFRVTVSEDGGINPSFSLEVSYDACLAWAKIALARRGEALGFMAEREKAWHDQPFDNDHAARILVSEFGSSMQAVVAAAICVDALYDQISPYSPIGESTRVAWRRKRTARHAQIAETIRSTFGLNAEVSKQLKNHLRALFTLRDKAVHPSSIPTRPQIHPDIGTLMEWRLAAFRGSVADVFVCTALGVLWELTRLEKFRTPELAKFMVDFRKGVDRVLPNGKPESSVKTVNIQIPSYKKTTNT